jgi:hypothetical protein
MRKKLPWFRVYSKLIEHEGFSKLSLADVGFLLKCWCIGYDGIPRGQLPELGRLSRLLGSYYSDHPTRVKNKLIELKDWFDFNTETARFVIHNAEYWQARPGEELPLCPIPEQSSVESSVESSVGFSGVGIENKRLPLLPDVPRGGEGKNTDILRISESNTREINTKGNGLKPRKAHVSDPRYAELKAFMEAEYAKFRNHALGSDTLAKDWIRYAAMLHRTKDDNSYSLQRLMNAFTRWLASNSNYDKSMSVGQWADSVHRYISAQEMQRPKLAAVPTKDYTDDELKWWLKKG